MTQSGLLSITEEGWIATVYTSLNAIYAPFLYNLATYIKNPLSRHFFTLSYEVPQVIKGTSNLVIKFLNYSLTSSADLSDLLFKK
jgi:hypothetical protein